LKVRLVKIHDDYSEYEALEDGTIFTSCGDHATFDIKELEEMKMFIKKGQSFQLLHSYLQKNSLRIQILPVLRCKDARFATGWCPHASVLHFSDPIAAKYMDERCVNWLRICDDTGLTVVHNKKCDVPEVHWRNE
jgi:hypothetical protein